MDEIGFAVCRGVPIIALKWGTDPYGFIGKFQALSCDASDVPKEIIKLLIKHPRMVDAYIEAVSECASFDAGNSLAELLPSIESLEKDQVKGLSEAFNQNVQLQGSYGFNGSKPSWYGGGLPKHLRRFTGRKYTIGDDGRLEEE